MTIYRLTAEQVRLIEPYMDFDKIVRTANELYGTSYRNEAIIEDMVSHDPNSPSQLGYIYNGSEYIAYVVFDGVYTIIFDQDVNNPVIFQLREFKLRKS